jgi:hypothetical protein
VNKGRMNLAEELGRLDNEKMNANRMDEKSRVISELNKGYKDGGKICKIAMKGKGKAYGKNS